MALVDKKMTVTAAAEGERVTDFVRATAYLGAVYQRLKEGNQIYSYRQFSEELGFGHTNYMHLIVTGQRRLTVKAGKRMAEALGLHGMARKYFEALVAYEVAPNPREKEDILATLVDLKHRSLPPTLDRDMLEYLSAWYHPVVREMVTVQDFCEDPAWIAEKIFPKISSDQAAASLELLLRLGYLTRDEASGKLVQREVNLRTGPVVRSLAVRQYHHEMLDLARAALMSVPAAQRDFQALTIPVNATLGDEIKQEIDRFWRWVLDRSAAVEKHDQVCQLNIQYFPVTKLREDKEK